MFQYKLLYSEILYSSTLFAAFVGINTIRTLRNFKNLKPYSELLVHVLSKRYRG